MSRRWGGVIAVLMLSLLWSTSSAEATWWLLNLKKMPGTISGQVRVVCQDPKGVLVYLAGRSFVAFTDADGGFILEWVPPGSYVLHVETVDPPAVHEQDVKVVSGRDTKVGMIEFGPDFQNDSNHCGSCNHACAAGVTCQAGVCGTAACAPGFADCDGVSTNGCETDLTTSAQHCGACGNACAAGQICQAGACVTGACPAGFGDCDGVAANGCEADLAKSAQHCGACGQACAAGQTCQGGTCVTAACAPGFADCDGVAANGCETSLGTVQNCGACGNVCSNNHGTASCSAAGTCQITCSAGFANCDAVAANGCETNVTTSHEHCGACGKACLVTQTCQAGVCQ